MSDANIPFRVIAEISGHHNLTQLHAYLEVKPDQVRGAIASLSMLSPDIPLPGDNDTKCRFPDLDTYPEAPLSIPELTDD